MKIRKGFVTNSSSTNFIIISSKEITVEYLFEKLGFQYDSPFESIGKDLCQNLYYSLERLSVTQALTKEREEKYGKGYRFEISSRSGNGQNIYEGATSSEEDAITTFFTCDSILLNDSEFYLNGRNCIW